MHVLVLCKRQYTSRDLLDDRYGRLYEIPEHLAALGHRVTGVTLSYRRRHQARQLSPAGVSWNSFNVLPAGPLKLLEAVRRLRKRDRPDVLWASSDAPCAVAGRLIARHLGIPLVVDLYDNYESFGLTRLPGMAAAFRRTCRDAAGLSVVSQTLADHLQHTLAPQGAVRVIGNGINPDLFHPMGQADCRRALQLPAHARLIGCAGALDASRGIADLFEAFLQLAEHHPDLHLVIAGPRDATPGRYRHPRIIDLGLLPWQRVPLLLNGLDVSIVCNRDDAFGRYCYPLKLQESLACDIHVVAAAVGDVPALLEGDVTALYRAGDSHSLADAIIAKLASSARPARPVRPADWQQRAAAVGRLLSLATRAEGPGPTPSPRSLDSGYF
ncbi:MAG TPA: glycosyltransferase family 4 protein [Stenotrophomonas sp.]|nr:glycosyltransferase family 4 protein [Stenotrophomonas sp.]